MVQQKLQIKTTGIDHVVLWVSDLARSKHFYMELLGMTVAHESDWQAFLHCGNQQVALFDASKRGMRVQSGALQHMALLMEPASYEETKSRVEEEGCSVEGRNGDPWCIYFDDPDGHRIQLLYKGHDD